MSAQRLGNLLAVLATGLADEQRRAQAKSIGLPETATAAVVALDQFLDGGRVGDLAGVLGLTHSGGVRLAAQLVDAGLVRRLALGDGREVGLRLTARGRRAAAQASAARRETVLAAAEGLSARQQADLERLLDRLVAGLTRERMTQRQAGGREPWLCRTCDLDACGREQGRCPAARVATGKS